MMKIKSKNKKFATWLKEHKAIVISVGSFLLTGLIALLIGFEIKEKGHAIRNFLAGPHATTLVVLLVCGLFFAAIFVASLIYMKKGDE